MRINRVWFSLVLILGLNLKIVNAFDLLYDLRIKTGYNSNILELSDKDLRRFENKNEVDKFKISSSDDFVSDFALRIGFRNPDFLGHTQIIRFSLNYEKYWNNEILDKINFGIRLKQYLSSKFNFELKYFYFPEIYVNRYDSVLDVGTDYRDFTYAKNSAYAEFQYRILEFLNLSYQVEYSQLLYNEFFTEYDADQYENRIRAIILPYQKLRLGLDYTYRKSNADGEKAYKGISEIEEFKDPSHQDDIYRISISFPLKIKKEKELELAVEFSYYEIYYDSNFRNDKYHYGRKDWRKNWKIFCTIPLGKKFSTGFYYGNDWRNVSSPILEVSENKDYKQYLFGLQLRFDN